MNPKVVLTVATVAAVAGLGEALGPFVLVAAPAAIAISGPALAGLAVLKGAAVLGGAALLASRGRGRGRRSADDTADATIELVARSVPQECMSQLICDLATGSFPQSENNVILNLFKDDVAENSPRFRFTQAAKLGAVAKDIRTCKVAYTCQLSDAEVNKLLA